MDRTQEIKDSGPRVPVDVSRVADALPHPVVRTAAGNKSPYVVLGKRYRVLSDSRGFYQRGNASWYGTKFHGKRTANGEIYNMYAMTAAHKTLPIPSYVRVTNVANNRSVIVRVNDRGPFHGNRIIDLSYTAAKKLGYADTGVASVIVEDITPTADSRAVISKRKADSAVKLNRPANRPIGETMNSATNNTADTSIGSHSPLAASAPAYLQVGAFKQRRGAEQLRAQLISMTHYPVVIDHDDNWYRVRIGPVHAAQSVAYLRRDLERQGHGKPLVIYEQF